MVKKSFLIPLVVILLVSAVLGLYFVTQQSGFSALSLSKVDFFSSDKDIGGTTFLLTVVQNGASQFAQGTFTPSEINGVSGSNEKVSKSLTITTELVDNSCDYSLRSNSAYLKKYEIVASKTFLFSSSVPQWASQYDTSEKVTGYVCKKRAVDYLCYAYRSYNVAQVGSLVFDRYNFKTDVSVKVGDESFSGSVSNVGDQSVTLSSGRVYASFQGLLGSGERCPSSSDEKVMSAYYNGRWILVDQVVYNAFSPNQVDNCFSGFASGVGTPESCVDINNRGVDGILFSNPYFGVYGGESSFVGVTSLSNGKYSIDLPKQLEFPVLSLRVKADTLGVVVPVGVPKIVSADSNCFTTGKVGNVVVDVKNVGGELSTFVGSVDCPKPFDQQGTSVRVQVGSGEVKTVNIPIVGVSSEEVKKSCSVKFSDLESGKSDTKSFDACVKSIVLCTPNDKRCEGNHLMICDVKGSGWDDSGESSDCKNDIIIDDCPALWSVTIPFIKDEIDVIPNIGCLLRPYIIFVSISLGALVFLFSLLFLRRRFSGKGDLPILLGISGVSSVVAGLIFYWLWWVFIIFFVILLIVFIVVNRSGIKSRFRRF